MIVGELPSLGYSYGILGADGDLPVHRVSSEPESRAECTPISRGDQVRNEPNAVEIYRNQFDGNPTWKSGGRPYGFSIVDTAL